jgi:hypothetical protein
MSDEDVLTRFRNRVPAKPPIVPTPRVPLPPELVVNHDAREEYKAFGTQDKLMRLLVRTGRSGALYAIPYGYMLTIAFNEIRCNELFFSASGTTVFIAGRNLWPVFDAISLHACAFVQAWYPERFAEPVDPAVPFIESILVNVLQAPSSGEEKA